MTIHTQTSGCKAMEGCTRKVTCLRHSIYQEQTAYEGWSAWQMCRVGEFTDSDYPFFIEVNDEVD